MNANGKYRANHINKKQRLLDEIFNTYGLRLSKDLTIKELNNLLNGGISK